MIAAIDAKLTEQVNQILHHEDFQKLESAWRGLHYLVNNTETDEKLKIRVMNISKKELHKTLKKFKGTAWDQSPLFKKVYEEEYGQFGGEPFGAIVGDYHFDQSPPDVELLGEMAKIAAAAHAPFITGAQLQPDADGVVAGTGQPARPDQDLLHARVRRLAQPARVGRLASTSACACRASSRALPYGAKTNPVEEFDFEEDTAGADHSKYTWANAAYAMATNINRSFKLYGWCSRIRGIESGGAVENLPLHTFPTDDGGVDMKCPTEIAISDRREAELSKAGLLPLIHRKNTDFAAFIGAQSLHKPAEYDDPDATANANLAARLPYLFACNRFAHYLKCIVRDKIGCFKETRRHGALAQQVDHQLRRRRSRELVGGNQGPQAARRGRGGGRGGRRQPRLLQLQVLPAPALPARRADRLAAPGVQAAVRPKAANKLARRLLKMRPVSRSLHSSRRSAADSAAASKSVSTPN